MKKKITLTNDFHNTSVNLLVDDDPKKDYHLSPGQARRARKTLCGIDGCSCSDEIGVRGMPHMQFIPTFDRATGKQNGGNLVDYSEFTFDLYITRKSLNGNAVAKYSNSNGEIKLVRECDGKEIDSVEIDEITYDGHVSHADDQGVDFLAYVLDNFFDCNMLEV